MIILFDFSLVILVFKKFTAAKLLVLLNIHALLILSLAFKVTSSVFFDLIKHPVFHSEFIGPDWPIIFYWTSNLFLLFECEG
tara:strand:+ start:94 stop:339 length:246 start_codon:yes stop_codon:yes gene_type:complete